MKVYIAIIIIISVDGDGFEFLKDAALKFSAIKMIGSIFEIRILLVNFEEKLTSQNLSSDRRSHLLVLRKEDFLSTICMQTTMSIKFQLLVKRPIPKIIENSYKKIERFNQDIRTISLSKTMDYYC